MNNFAVVAAFFGFLNVLAMFADFTIITIPLFIITAIFASIALANPGKEAPGNSRTLAIFSILFAAVPFVRPYIEHLAYVHRERIQAKRTAPTYVLLDGAVQSFEPALDQFYDSYGQYPTMIGGELLPMFAADGTLLQIDSKATPSVPGDPFGGARPLEVVALGQKGTLILSVGQDGIGEFPPARVTTIIDGQPNEPLACLAWTGFDIREHTYDPTNGSLSSGDIVYFHGPSDKTRKEVLRPLIKAWDTVDALTPPPPKKVKDTWPPAEDDALTAESLIADKDYLGAMIAASRAIQNRRPHPNFWTTPQLKKAEYYRARACYELGHFRQAADFYIDYLGSSPNDAEAHFYLGACMYLGGQPEYAKRHFAAAFQIDPNATVVPQAMAAWEALDKKQTPTLPLPWIREQLRKDAAKEKQAQKENNE